MAGTKEPTGYSLYITDSLPDFASDRGRFNRIQDYYYEGVSE